MQQIKLVALDLDGTVFNDQKQITPRTRAAAPCAACRNKSPPSPACAMR